MSIVVREGKVSDIREVAQLEKECFSSAWTDEMFESFLNSSTGRFIIIEDSGRICAYICLYIIGGEKDNVCGDCELANIAVSSDYRRRGLARRLIGEMYESAEKEYCSEIFLEVRESNAPAISLYMAEGFEIYGRRKKYYNAPTEDAILMKKTIANQVK